MMVRWEGQVPPDWASWRDAVRRGLGEDAAFYWVRFHREPGGWRFDLERRVGDGFQQAEESVALQVYEALVEGGQPVDPGWMPFEDFPSAPTPPETGPAAERAPAETRTEAAVSEASPAEAAPEASEPPPPSGPSPPVAADRHAAWRRLLPAVVYGPAVLLVALALWLSRDRLRPRPEPPPAPSPVATASADALAAQKRLQELEAVVAQLQRERAEAPRRESARPARPPASPAAPATQPPATPEPAAPPPPSAPSPDEPVAPTPAAATDAPPQPAAPERGQLVDLGDPGVSPPVLVTQGQARYPPRALERRLSGTVWLRALIDETGAVAQVALVRASVSAVGFEDEAIRHVRTRLYTPASQQGVAVRVWVPIAVEFRLPGR